MIWQFLLVGAISENQTKKIRWNIKCLIRHIFPAYKIYKRKIPYIIVGVETGPISFFLNRILIRKIFDGAEKVSVRNEESKIFLKKIKVKREIEVNPDWIMGIDKNEFLVDDVDYNFFNDKNKKYIFVHLSYGINVSGMENVIKDLKKFQKKHKNIIYLFGCDQENQEEKVKTLFNRFDNKKNQLFYYKSPWELSTILKNVDSVITDKLHVGIVATRYGKEVICTARDPKSLRFYNLIRRNECVSLLKNVKKGETLHKLERLKFKKIFIDNKIFEKAKNNKKIVEDFLNKY